MRPAPHRLHVVAAERAHYRITFEQAGDVTFCHCEVDHWSPEVKRQMVADLDTLCSLRRSPLFVWMEPENEKLSRFCHSVGFVDAGDIGAYRLMRRV